jgi:hypothetical protein
MFAMQSAKADFALFQPRLQSPSPAVAPTLSPSISRVANQM